MNCKSFAPKKVYFSFGAKVMQTQSVLLRNFVYVMPEDCSTLFWICGPLVFFLDDYLSIFIKL